MTSVRVTHGIDALAKDARRVPAKALPRMTKVVDKNTKQGMKVAQGLAKSRAGRHGTNYWKRITSEMVSPLVGEYGPTGDVAGNAVGAGWRNGPPNTDLPKSADLQGPRLASDAGKIFNGLFW